MFDAKTTRTPKDKTVSGWFDIAPDRQATPALSGNIETDWLIVGSGFTGLAAAYRLSQLTDESITVIDAQALAWGASGRNSGFMIDLPHDIQSDDYTGGLDKDKATIRRNREAIAFAGEAAKQFGLTEFYSETGKYHGAANEQGLSGLTGFQQHLTALGEDFTVLDHQAMQAVTGTDYYIGGLFTPSCVMIQPAAYTQGWGQGLVNQKRIRLYENTPALSIKSGTPHTVTTPAGSIKCQKLLLTNNGHIESFGLHKKRLVHLHLFGSMTRKLSNAEQATLGGQAQWGLIPALPMGSTVRRYKDRIVMRNHISYTPTQSESVRANQRSAQRHKQSFKNRFPMLNDVEMEYQWAGALCLSLNSVSAFGEVEKGVFVAACQNGLGLTSGTLAGKAIAEHACGESSDSLDFLLTQNQPKRIVPEPFMSIGAKTRLWWGQRAAGLDL
ncbi:MAG: glycine/D-amino acid oxidase-like deaminating enzyme [Saprospiraceae bacterium]|jgi:glycine/D-amino acid oxidase-like deaminating enzyme